MRSSECSCSVYEKVVCGVFIGTELIVSIMLLMTRDSLLTLFLHALCFFYCNYDVNCDKHNGIALNVC